MHARTSSRKPRRARVLTATAIVGTLAAVGSMSVRPAPAEASGHESLAPASAFGGAVAELSPHLRAKHKAHQRPVAARIVTALDKVDPAVVGAFLHVLDGDPAHPSVVGFGDSVPAGNQCDCTPFVETYAGLVAGHTHKSVPVANYSRGGYTTWNVLDQLQDADVQQRIKTASTVIVMIGANDFNGAFNQALAGQGSVSSEFTPVQQTVQANVTTIVKQIQQTHVTPVRVMVLDYWNVEKDGSAGLAMYGTSGEQIALDATADCTQALREAAAATGAQFISTVPVFKGADGNGDPTALLAPDGDHPDAGGHDAIAQAVYSARPNG